MDSNANTNPRVFRTICTQQSVANPELLILLRYQLAAYMKVVVYRFRSNSEERRNWLQFETPHLIASSSKESKIVLFANYARGGKKRLDELN